MHYPNLFKHKVRTLKKINAQSVINQFSKAALRLAIHELQKF
jgi:hypothetical protein